MLLEELGTLHSGSLTMLRTDHQGADKKMETANAHVTVCDINKAMLDVGQQRAARFNYSSDISWIQGDAEELPVATASVDAYTIAFGIRNVTRIPKALTEAYRVLAPGGRFLCLEFSEVKNELLASAYEKYSFDVIPVMGHIIAGDWKSYQYLVESIRQFPNQVFEFLLVVLFCYMF